MSPVSDFHKIQQLCEQVESFAIDFLLSRDNLKIHLRCNFGLVDSNHISRIGQISCCDASRRLKEILLRSKNPIQ